MSRPDRWILLRGLTREQGHWGPFTDRLRAGLEGATIEVFDLPGAGERRDVRAPLSVGGLVRVVRDAVRPAGGSWLFGLSLGGMVAYEWIRLHPEEVAGAVLINTSMGGLSPPWRRMRLSAAAGVLGAFFTGDPLVRERRIFALTSARADLAAASVAAWAELARRRPVRRMNALRQLAAAALYRARPLPAPSAPPMLVLTSRGDRLVDPTCGVAVARATRATLREHPTAGHDLPLDDPEWVVDAVVGWRREL